MKKTLALATGIAASALPFTQAFAQGEAINVCPPDDQFYKLCQTLNGTGKIGPIIGFVVNVLFTVAIIIALVFLIWGGLKWVLSGGDKSKVQAARETIIAALIGLVVTFAAYFLLNIVLGFFGLSINNLDIPTLPGL